jgi:hypothetical protein
MEALMLILFGLPEDRSEERRDTIVTLNYDILPEDALHNLRIPFTYGIPSGTRIPYEASFDHSARSTRPSDFAQIIKGERAERRIDERAIRVLKLHGSVNWTAGDKEVVIHGTYEDVRKKGKASLLVPPTWRKALGGPLLAIWDAAVEALRTATNVVIIGYSMPLTDQHFKYLLAAGLQGNISLRQIIFVNPQASQLESSLFQILREDLSPQTVQLHAQRASEFISRAHSFMGRDFNARFRWG